MKHYVKTFPVVLLAAVLSSCATNSLKSSWKSPEFSQPVSKIALVVVDERPVVRKTLESQFAVQLERRGTAAVRTHEYMPLDTMKADRKATAARLRELGADSVLIIRVADRATYAREVRPGSSMYLPYTVGGDWYNAYEVAFMDMSATYSSVITDVFLENSLFELNSGKRIWSGISKTILKETTDKLEEVRPLVAIILDGMAKDGVIK